MGRLGALGFARAPARVMLSAVRSQRGVPAWAGLVAVSVLFAACSTTTNGSGAASTPATRRSSTPGFPSSTARETTPAETTTPPPATTSSIARTPTVIPAPATPLKRAVVHALHGRTYVVKIWADVRNDTCFDHAYGKAITTFLTQHPCTGLERYLGTTTVNGRPVGFNESATAFRGTAADPYKWAGRFAELENQDGTGSINDLLREGYRLPSGPSYVPSPDAFNVIGQDAGVTVWDVWYLDGSTPYNDKALITMTEDIFLQF
jgi:hypothetical protein